ncbi:MAG: biotin--[acetyl-CoA-carboxylase] ligase, partial [Desulfobacula sp.]
MSHFLSDLTPEERDGQKGYGIKTCTSTMDLAWDMHEKGLFPEYAFVRAESQTRGRGQFRREWVSEPGNLFVTLRLADSTRILDNLLPLAVALCVVGALKDLHLPARIKWPNDIMMGQAKVGGILIEQKSGAVMAGIGINIGFAPESSHKENFFHIKSGCLKKSGVNLEASRVWRLIFEKIRRHMPGMMKAPEKVAKDTEALLA